MTVRSWIRKLFARSPRTVRTPVARCRPALEPLEYRCVPAIFTVTTTADAIDGGTLADPTGPDGKLSLREAINLANLSPGLDTVQLPRGRYNLTLTGQG